MAKRYMTWMCLNCQTSTCFICGGLTSTCQTKKGCMDSQARVPYIFSSPTIIILSQRWTIKGKAKILKSNNHGDRDEACITSNEGTGPHEDSSQTHQRTFDPKQSSCYVNGDGGETMMLLLLLLLLGCVSDNYVPELELSERVLC
jgi:hypothetical protein